MNNSNNTGFPMSDMQKAYWINITDGILENSSRIQYYCEYELSEFDLDKFKIAWNKVVNRHDMLRTVALDGGKQQILDHLEHDLLVYTDLRELEQTKKQEIYAMIRDKLSHRKFSCSESPQFDLHLLHDTSATKFILNLNMWAIDAPSVNIILSDLADYYYSPDQELPKITYKFQDYIRQYYEEEKTSEYIESEQYWYNRLDSINEPPKLPCKYSSLTEIKNLGKVKNFQQLSYTFSCIEVSLLQDRAKALGVNVDTLILSAFAEVIKYWNESESFSLNIPRFTRPEFSDQINDIVGEFSSFSILSLNLANIATFEQRIHYIHMQYMADLQHAQVSGNKLLRRLAQNLNLTSLTTFPVVFTLSHGLNPRRDALKNKLFGDIQYDISHTPNVQLDCRQEFCQGKLVIKWDYARDYFANNCIETMFQVFISIVDSLIDADYYDYVKKNNVIALPDDQKKVRQAINNNQVPYQEKPLFRQFAELMEIPGLSVTDAVICQDTMMTYQELFDHTCQLGAFINNNIISTSQQRVIAILLPKGGAQIVSVWGILASGSAYLPLDIDQPVGRIAQILADAKSSLLIVNDETRHLVPDNINIPVLNIEHSKAIFAMDPVPLPIDLPGYYVSEEDLIYLMYTSGTTGDPKGVMIRHKGVNNAIDYSLKTFVSFSEKLVVLGVSALHHDMSVFDTLGTILHKGLLILPQESKRKDPDVWAKIIQQYNVNFIVAVPAIIEMLLTWSEFKKYSFASIKTVLMGGDWISANILQRMQAIFPDNISAYSVGGPTETTMWNIANKIKNEPDWSSVPYGYPIQNCSYHLLNHRLQDVPDWVVGEMYCSGISLAKGYLNDEQRTAEKFIFHPVTKERLYKTGDLGLYHSDGRIEFVGRQDGQIKIRGIRIESGEVQVKLGNLPEVARAVVYVYQESLAAALVIRPGFAKIAEAELYDRCKKLLPISMIPTVWIQLETLPLTKNQKVDFKELKHITGEYLSSGEIVPEQNQQISSSVCENELKLVTIWETLLNKKVTEQNDNFFSLGGDSLSLIRLATEILNQLKVQVSFAELLMNLNIKDQVNIINQRAAEQINEDENTIPHLDRDEYPLLSNQEDIWLAERFSSGKIKFRIIVGFIADEELDYVKMEQSLDEMRNNHWVLSLLFSLTSKGLAQHSNKNRSLPLFVEESINESELATKINEIESKQFNLCNEYGWRVHLLPLSNGSQAWIFNFHHIIFDGWSINLFLTELQNRYNRRDALKESAINYGDYVCWKKELVSRYENESLNYWSSILAETSDLISVSGDEKPESSIIQETLSLPTSELLCRFCKQNKTTPFIVLFSIFQLTLLEFFNKDKFLVGISDSGREHPDIENMLGCFINTPIFCVKKMPECSLISMIDKVKEDYANVLKYPVPAFSQLIKQLGKQGKKNGFNDFCQVCFVMQPSYAESIFFGSTKMKKLPIVSHEVRLIYEMSCWQQQNDEFILMLNFDRSKVQEQDARRLMSEYIRFINTLIDKPDKPVTTIV